jgi:hypothetical protein
MDLDDNFECPDLAEIGRSLSGRFRPTADVTNPIHSRGISAVKVVPIKSSDCTEMSPP